MSSAGKGITYTMIILLAVLLSGCGNFNQSLEQYVDEHLRADGEADPVGPAASVKAILAFSVSDPGAGSVQYAGIVNEGAKTVGITVPNGTPVNSMTASVTFTGASIASTPAGGTAGGSTSPVAFTGADFSNPVSNPVSYTVTAGDNSTQDYTVTVDVSAFEDKEILAFSVSVSGSSVRYAGTIIPGTPAGTPGAISITVPYGTDRTSLLTTVSYKGKSLNHESGQVVDFTNSVTYTVTAGDNSTQDYTVTVLQAANGAKIITGFTLAGSEGTITGTNIVVAVPSGINLTALAPTTINYIGESISPGVGEARNFSSPVTYTVTAADGSTQPYLVTVTLQSQGGTISVTFTGVPADQAASLGDMGLGSNSVSWLTDSLALTVPTTSFPGASYQWYKDGIALTNVGTITGATTNTLNISAREFSIARNHELTVMISTVGSPGVVYSKTLTFEVQ
ncbi:hypothetical protein AGMMS49940_21700 [Spirochaetia bacterium]|nr:hypothetical protein AGMMS49940_21700 [Spirochaetia bacterium]